MPDPGTALSVGGPLVLGAISGDSAGSAAQTQSNSADAAIAEQDKIYNQNRADLAPFRDAGSASVTQLSYLLGLPGYNPSGNNANLQALTTAAGNQASGAYVDSNGDPVGKGDNHGIPAGALAPNQIDYNAIIKNRPDVVADRGTNQSALYDWYVKHGYNASAPMAFALPSATGASGAGSGTTGPSSLVNTDPATGGGTYGSLLHNFTNADFVKDPGYDFRLSEGNKAIERSAAARGGLLSGAEVKAADNYAQNYASNEFNNAYNRFQTNRNTTYNYLSGLDNTGASATNAGVASSNNTANQVSSLLTDQGNVNAAGQVAQGNIWSNGLSSVTSALNSGKIGSFLSPSSNGIISAASQVYG